MKARTVGAAALIGALCLLSKVAPAIMEVFLQGGTSASSSGSPKHRHIKNQWLADARTAVAAIHYLLEAEPADLNMGSIASNTSRKNVHGPNALLFQKPPANQSPAFGSTGELASPGFEKGAEITGQTVVASIAPLPFGMLSTQSLRLITLGPRFPASLPAIPLGQWSGLEGRGLPRVSGLEFVKLLGPVNAVATNSQNTSNSPSKNYQPGPTDFLQRPV